MTEQGIRPHSRAFNTAIICLHVSSGSWFTPYRHPPLNLDLAPQNDLSAALSSLGVAFPKLINIRLEIPAKSISDALGMASDLTKISKDNFHPLFSPLPGYVRLDGAVNSEDASRCLSIVKGQKASNTPIFISVLDDLCSPTSWLLKMGKEAREMNNETARLNLLKAVGSLIPNEAIRWLSPSTSRSFLLSLDLHLLPDSVEGSAQRLAKDLYTKYRILLIRTTDLELVRFSERRPTSLQSLSSDREKQVRLSKIPPTTPELVIVQTPSSCPLQLIHIAVSLFGPVDKIEKLDNVDQYNMAETRFAVRFFNTDSAMIAAGCLLGDLSIRPFSRETDRERQTTWLSERLLTQAQLNEKIAFAKTNIPARPPIPSPLEASHEVTGTY